MRKGRNQPQKRDFALRLSFAIASKDDDFFTKNQNLKDREPPSPLEADIYILLCDFALELFFQKKL